MPAAQPASSQLRDEAVDPFESALQLYGRATEYAISDVTKVAAHNGYAWVLVDKLNRDLEDVGQESDATLANLRRQMLWLSLFCFAATVLRFRASPHHQLGATARIPTTKAG